MCLRPLRSITSCLLWERDLRKALSQKGPLSSSWCALAASCAVFTLSRRCGHCGRGYRSHGLEGGKPCGSPTGGGTTRKPLREISPPHKCINAGGSIVTCNLQSDHLISHQRWHTSFESVIKKIISLNLTINMLLRMLSRAGHAFSADLTGPPHKRINT